MGEREPMIAVDTVRDPYHRGLVSVSQRPGDDKWGLQWERCPVCRSQDNRRYFTSDARRGGCCTCWNV